MSKDLKIETKEGNAWVDYEMYQRGLLWRKMCEEIWWRCIPEYVQAYLEDPVGCEQYNNEICQEIINKEEYKCFKNE